MFFIWSSDTILINSTLQEIISRLEIEQQEQKDEHRKEMIELSNYIDEMREREEKKDIAYRHKVMFEITESTQPSLSQAMKGLVKHLSSIY